MPIPWDPELLKEDHTHTHRTAWENAITLKQLSDLSTFVQRLCKMGLLKYTSNFSQKKGLFGNRIEWTEINMHDINDGVIQKLIHKDNSCSWVEIVTREVQRSNYFCSHNWAEPFRDFMRSIAIHAEEVKTRIHDKFFVCTFANDQWNVDLGDRLATTPFYLALVDADSVVLMLDKKGSALSRLWCIFEVATALQQNKEFHICSPVGRVGEKGFTSGPVVQAIRSVDCRHSQASSAVDQRQIMNFIAQVDEDRGLVRDSTGTKVLDDVEESDDPIHFKYKYEEQLVEQYEDNFTRLNAQVSDYAAVSSERLGATYCQETRGCVVDDFGLRALTLSQMRSLIVAAKHHIFAVKTKAWRCEKNIKSWCDVTWFHLMEFMQECCAAAGKNSYMECISGGPQKPEFVIACALGSNMEGVMDALEWHAEARQFPGSTTYWALACATNEAECDAYIAKHSRTPSFAALPHSVGLLAIIDTTGRILTGALPALEIFDCISQRKLLDFACPTGALATTRPFQEGWEFGTFDASIAQSMLNFDVCKVTGNLVDNVEHTEMVKCVIAGMEYAPGDKAPTHSKGYELFNDRIRSRAVGPILRDCAYVDGGAEKIAEIMSLASKMMPVMNSPALRGHSGEFAIHAAAACGQIDTVQLLLLRKASPNIQDNEGETPLHFASMGGHADVVELLLRNGADATIESYFGETALLVAEESPVAFLGVDSRGVIDKIHEWQVHSAIKALETENFELRSNVKALERDNEQLQACLAKGANELEEVKVQFEEVNVRMQLLVEMLPAGAGGAAVLGLKRSFTGRGHPPPRSETP